jgi:hypothetical protein
MCLQKWKIMILSHYFIRASFIQLSCDSRVAPMRLPYGLHTSGIRLTYVRHTADIRPAYGWHTSGIRLTYCSKLLACAPSPTYTAVWCCTVLQFVIDRQRLFLAVLEKIRSPRRTLLTTIVVCLLSDYCGILRSQLLLITTFAPTHDDWSDNFSLGNEGLVGWRWAGWGWWWWLFWRGTAAAVYEMAQKRRK